METIVPVTKESLEEILKKMSQTEEFGQVLRAKGIVASDEGEWFHFDYVPGEREIRRGGAEVTGRLCVIGAKLDEAAIARAFGL